MRVRNPGACGVDETFKNKIFFAVFLGASTRSE